MSRFCGKFDLYDTIYMTSGEETDDDLFEKFKKRTGGKLYQNFKLKLTDYNIDKEIESKNNPKLLSKIEHVKEVDDKRVKSGKRTVKSYTYIYFGKEYKSLAEINRQGYYATRTINFEDKLDLVPYYAYIVGVHASDPESETVVIGNESYVDQVERSFRENGLDTNGLDYYRKALKKEYIRVVLEQTMKEGIVE